MNLLDKTVGLPDSAARRRIAVVLQDLAGGGAERVMLNLAKGLAGAGHEVQLVLVRRAGAYLTRMPADVEVVTLNSGRTIKSIGPLARYLRAQQPDAVISALPHVNIITVLARALSNRPTTVIVTEHIHVSVDRYKVREPLVRASYRVIPFVYRLADHVVAVSNGAADDLARVLRVERSRVQMIYNPIDVDDIVASNGTKPDHKWFAAGAHKILLGVGRLTEQKDFPTLIRALGILRREDDWKLIVLGDGPDRDDLLALIREANLSEHVDLAGFRHDSYRFMAYANAFALSSKWEALPTVLIEALACGVPIVSTDCPSGPREILDGGRFGRLVPVGDSSALAAAVSAQARTPLDKGQSLARAYSFSTQKAVQNYLHLIATTGRN
jgi:glycosyltransferase involved in cell wall biosynthesis